MIAHFSKNEYEFIRFDKSTRLNKKYSALLKKKNTSKYFRIHFGTKDELHFYDRTNLGFFTHLDHLDFKIRWVYRKSKQNLAIDGYFSSIYFDLNYLN